ncbi:MAG: BACON domain-containing protein, partial [Armatimonadetes bacterium]|nr:BACON domain-containing protein [Armatimonadota bacterium]
MGARWDGRRAAVLLGALLVLLAPPVPPGNAPSGIPEGSEARAAPACTYAISPTNQAIPAGGVSVTVRVSAPAGCSWSTYNAQPWVTVVSGSGSGNGTVTIVVAANPSTRTRAGTVLVAGQPFTVMQAEGPSGCSYSVAPSSQSVGARGGSGNVSVSAPAGCAWVASST